MINNIFIVILLALVVEAITEILTSSELTEPLRQAWKQYVYSADDPPKIGFWTNFKIWVDKLITCGYCTSVWVSILLSILSPILFEPIFVNWFCFVFILHRLSNFIHVVFELIKKGRVKTYDLEIIIKPPQSKSGD